MSESNDTSIIDDKKLESEGENTKDDPSYGKFFTSLLIILFILIYFLISSYVLYACKIAQTNILPTDINCYPYTDNKPEIESTIETNIFKTLFSDPALSVKLNIPYNDYNSKISILDTLRKYKDSSSSHYLVNYIISIFETLVSRNFGILNYILNSLNQIPEVIIVLLGPIFISFIMPFIVLFNCLYGVYLWFYNMSWFFKKNTSSKGNPVWEDVSIMEPFGYACAIGLIIIFTILFFITAPYIWFSLISVFFVMFTLLSYKSTMNNKSVGLIEIFLDVLKFYKMSFVTITCIFIITSAFINLGTTFGFVGLGILFFIWYGLISFDLFNSVKLNNLTPIVSGSDEQAPRGICKSQDIKQEESGFFSNIINKFSGKQSGGKNISDRLKKLNKKINNR